MFRLPSGLYFSACLGSLFLSILCTCCSHFFRYCFISFTIFCAPVFPPIHWFFSLSNFVISSKCLKEAKVTILQSKSQPVKYCHFFWYCFISFTIFCAPVFSPNTSILFFRAVIFKLLVWCGAEGYVSGLQNATASCKPDTWPSAAGSKHCIILLSSWWWA